MGDVEAAMNAAARSRMIYLLTGNQNDLNEYKVATVRTLQECEKLQRLTKDNPVQEARTAQLQAAIEERQRVAEEAIVGKQQGHSVDLAQLLPQNVALAAKTAAVAEEVREEENRLLVQRAQIAHKRFCWRSVRSSLVSLLRFSCLRLLPLAESRIAGARIV